VASVASAPSARAICSGAPDLLEKTFHVVDVCTAQKDAHTGHGLIKLGYGTRFFVGRASDLEHDNVLWSTKGGEKGGLSGCGVHRAVRPYLPVFEGAIHKRIKALVEFAFAELIEDTTQ
jgi:hypothetical protein